VKCYILVPLDGSTLPEAILPQAVAIAGATESALILLQVLEPVYELIFGASGLLSCGAWRAHSPSMIELRASLPVQQGSPLGPFPHSSNAAKAFVYSVIKISQREWCSEEESVVSLGHIPGCNR
jgi:hypothetical protein